MALFNIGCTWEQSQLNDIEKLHHYYPANKIVEVYGSTVGTRSARAQNRVQSKTLTEAGEYIKRAKDIGVDVKWTFNMSCVGDLADFEREWDATRPMIEELSRLGVKKYIVTIPLVAELLIKEFGAEVEVSTITRISTLQELESWYDLGAAGVCIDVMQNRNIPFLKRAIKFSHKRHKYIEVIVNELCTFMCIHRNVCYNLGSHSSSREPFNGYPYQRCIEFRSNNPQRWISTQYILPTWVGYYEALGVDRFKVTGRTHETHVISRIAECYMSGRNPANLLDLWPHINSLVSDPHNPSEELYIPTSDIGLFRSALINRVQPCVGKHCNEDCGLCEIIYDRAVK